MNRCNTSLATIRDALLPKLLNGEIRVGALDAAAQEVSR